MAAKLLHKLADDNADLQKQIGCMNGFFQIFDRHHVLTGRRASHKRLTLGSAHVDGAYDQQKSSFQDPEKQRLSTESSRLSFSSSCSSSLSSPDFNKGPQPEASTFDKIAFPESPARDNVTMMSEKGIGLHSLDLRDVVRDSMYREARGLSVKTPMAREEVGRRYNEVGTKDAPRHSLDSRETMKSRQKPKELPRLSLDSRERCVMRNPDIDLKAGPVSESFSGGRTVKRPPSVVAKLMGLEALPGSPLARDIRQFSPKKSSLFEDNFDPFSRSLREKSLNCPIRFSPGSPRSSGKDPTSPSWRNADFVMKPLSSSRFPVEPAPWRQLERNRPPLKKQASKPVKARSQITNSNSSPSVYSEMEKRLKDLEFKHSGKDLRALKQILEAMQSKGFLETRKQGQSPNLAARRDYEMANSATSSKIRGGVSSSSSSSSVEVFESPIVIMKPAKLVEKAGIPASSLIPIHSLSGLGNIHNREERTVDDKRASTGNRAGKDRVSSTDKKASRRNLSSSAKPEQVSKENASKSSGSISPRLRQKKLEIDKRSRPPTPPSDSRRQSTRKPIESTSPGGRRRPKANKNSQQNDDQLSQVSNESETEAAGIGQDIEADTGKSPSSAIEAAKTVVSNLIQNKSCSRFTEDSSSANLSVSAPEYPSPVSVLDASVYREISSSPVKTQNTTGNGSNGCEDQWNPAYSFAENTSGFSPEINRKKLRNVEHLVQKLRRLNSSHDEASQDYIASLCETTGRNSDHRYISEILLASGLLLRDLGSGLTTFQLHPSGHPINPELFLVLEQTKGSSKTKALNEEKLHRKLMFDAVNEILVEKLAFVEAATDPWTESAKMAKKALSAQQLLKELCSEIETLQRKSKKRSENLALEEEEEDDFLKGVLSEDVIVRSGNWSEFNSEISGLVLDIERLLFKDLVDEIVHGGTGRLRAKTSRRRTLFSGQ
ncbi:PREDICTED: protein LONGIFOLIA 1 [Tarenaya hassleriana]|uniref:protein LONGIFOLIA 1 n=1 Tax=Tarenaya hassleriana TaxID=28532 RepID=UPI00053CA56B|nr:PREDICTED: protein LONGIFOLIA 1 [Tarenaya hassleriana]